MMIMRWYFLLAAFSIVCVHIAFSECDVPPCWYRSGKFPREKHGRPCLNETLCTCSEATVDCSFQNFTFVPFVGPGSYLYLNLSDNNLRNISGRHFFGNVSGEVEEIDLFNNGLVYLSPAAFRELSRLKRLYLGGSNNLTYKDLPLLMSIRGGVSLDLSCLGLRDIPPLAFRNASISKTTELDFSWNFIPSLNLSVFQFLRNVSFLIFSHNEIYDLNTTYLPTVQNLSLRDNRLFDFPKTCSSFNRSLFPRLLNLSLDKNMIAEICGQVCLPNLAFLSLRYNKILTFSTNMFSTTRFPSLTSLNIMQMEGKIDQIQQFFLNNSRVVDLVFIMNHVDFGRPKIHEDAFGGCSRLRNLLLWTNNFADVSDSRFEKLFRPLKGSLKYLSLGDTQISQITEKTFSGLKKLEALGLYKNNLAGIPAGAFDQLPKLKYLSLANNSIASISPTTFSPELQNRLKLLTLSGNPFYCSCDILWFQRWMKTRYEIFVDFHTNSYTCTNVNNITLPDFVLNEQACMLGSDAAAFTISITCVFILFFLLFSLFFRFRWHVRLWLYEACRGRQQRQRLRGRRRFKYDLFVSYAEENMGWVEHRLIPVLEGEWGLRLCVHQRDFVPGKHIVDNISDCVAESERILLVFSPFFARSEWCQFELKFCQTCVMERDDVLVIVALQAVGSREMTGAMMAVLRTTTYVEWEAEEEEVGEVQAMFWERLHVALEDSEGLV